VKSGDLISGQVQYIFGSWQFLWYWANANTYSDHPKLNIPILRPSEYQSFSVPVLKSLTMIRKPEI
jgi:hypothetical protein